MTRTLTEVVETTDYPTTSAATVAARSRALSTHAAARQSGASPPWRCSSRVVGPRSGWTTSTRRPRARPGTTHRCGLLLDLPQGEAPQVAYLDGDAFVTASGARVTAPAFRTATTAATVGRRRAGGGPYDDAAAVRRHLAGVGRLGTTSRLRDPVVRGGERRPGVLALRGLPVRRPGAGGPRHDGHVDVEGRDLLPGREHEPRLGGRRHPGAPAGRRVERTGPDRPGRLAQPDSPRRGGRGRVAVGGPGGGHRPPGQPLGDRAVDRCRAVACPAVDVGALLGLRSLCGGDAEPRRADRGGGRRRRRDQGRGHGSPGHVEGPARPAHRRTSGVGGRRIGAGGRGGPTGQQAIVRVGIDGTITRATAVAPAGEGSFRLAATP